MPISEDDLNYLRNINTRPGPNAGKSIDPTKPGPSDKTDKWDREHVKRRAIVQDERGRFEAIDKAALAQSDAEPKGLQLVNNGDPICLRDCPEGLFLFNGTLCFKSEYKTEVPGPQWQCDAYVVESGEYFQGGAGSSYERERLVVQPLVATLAQDAIARARAADRGVYGELIPDCPTGGVAARQGNGG